MMGNTFGRLFRVTTCGVRRDPSLCPRIYPVCETMVRMAILDAVYMDMGYRHVAEMIAGNDRRK